MAFRFKHFSLSHSVSPMKVGTDGVTLGAWAPAGGSVLDVGAGCGVVGLMLAQRGASHVTMIEISPAGAGEALQNAFNSPWRDRVEVVCGDFLTYNTSRRFDSIVSNPPFFKTGLLAPDESRAAARHQGELTPEAFMQCAAPLLNPGGSISIIIPPDRLADWTFGAKLGGLAPHEVCSLITKPGAKPRRLLVNFRADGCSKQTRLELNSPEYRQLTADFYL